MKSLRCKLLAEVPGKSGDSPDQSSRQRHHYACAQQPQEPKAILQLRQRASLKAMHPNLRTLGKLCISQRGRDAFAGDDHATWPFSVGRPRTPRPQQSARPGNRVPSGRPEIGRLRRVASRTCSRNVRGRRSSIHPRLEPTRTTDLGRASLGIEQAPRDRVAVHRAGSSDDRPPQRG
jgi:hypothetical protein